MENVIATKTIYQPDTAIFIDNDKTVINVKVFEQFTVRDWQGNEIPKENTFVRTIKVEPSPVFEEFIEQVSLDQVEENTTETNKILESDLIKQEERIEQKVVEKIKDQNFKIDLIDNEKNNDLDFLNLQEEQLFKLKLSAFEIEEVKNSSNRELKASLRKSKNFMEVVAYTAAIIIDK